MPTQYYKKLPYRLDDHDKNEKMTVTQAVRIKQIGDEAAKVYQPGDVVTVTGTDKKAMYYDDVICYPEEFEKVMAAKKSKYTVITEGPADASSMNALTGDEGKKEKVTKKQRDKVV